MGLSTWGISPESPEDQTRGVSSQQALLSGVRDGQPHLSNMSLGTRHIPEPPPMPLLPLGTPGPCLYYTSI